MTTFQTVPGMASRERRIRRLNEILWVMVAFLLLLTFFNIILWPMLRSEEFEKKAKELTSASSEMMPANVQPAKLVFTEDANGRILYKDKVVKLTDLKNIFGQHQNPEVEIMLISRDIVTIFFECYQSQISPTVRLMPFGRADS